MMICVTLHTWIYHICSLANTIYINIYIYTFLREPCIVLSLSLSFKLTLLLLLFFFFRSQLLISSSQYRNMNNDYRDDNSCCYFHPKEVVVGVCRFCLNERLLILAAKQGQHHHHNHYSSSTRSSSSHRSTYYHHQGITANNNKKPHSINLPKIFAFGSLLNRLEFRHWKSDSYSDHDASSSQEDSFISIKFEDNGVGSWEKGTVSKVSLDHCSVSWKPKLEANEEQQPQKHTKTVIEHAKPRPSLRWRKRIGHLFQVMRWKRSSKANACHAGSTKVEGVKVRNKGWIRTLTKRSKE